MPTTMVKLTKPHNYTHKLNWSSTKQIQINTMCVCISLSAYVTLFCLFSPKVSIILLHPDKNVRKLTMNSATYKRPFKPVSSMASVDGRYNTTGGTYNGAQTDGGSGGPMSTTSNVLNLGESTLAHQDETQTGTGREKDCRGNCCCFRCGCQYVGLGCGACCGTGPRLYGNIDWSNLSFTCCWMGLTRWLSQCCSIGELGTTTAMELDSHTYQPASTSTAAKVTEVEPNRND